MAEQNNKSSNLSWYIGIVKTIDDPLHRRRIQVRGPKENDEEALTTEKLDWIQPLQLSQDYFALPEIEGSVLVLQFNGAKFWVELPNKAAWQEFGDDYATAWLFTHKDVLTALYKQSTGFDFTLVGNVHIKTDKTEWTLTGDIATFDYDNVHIETDGASMTCKVNQVEFSTDGSKATLKNGSQNLATIIAELQQALASHTHQSAVGPVTPPINLAQFQQNAQKFTQLLQ